jgi:cyclopropane fatty-acyl-phospholipid synthase-like methyltransferase
MSEWWEDMFSSETWQRVQLGWDSVEDASEQADRIVEVLRLERGERVLDVPCGTGRVAIELATRGFEVVGVDAERRFLDGGRQQARVRGVDVALIAGDMRELTGVGTDFDAALCFWGSFGYFDEDGNRAQAAAVARSLRPGGRFLIDTIAADTVFPRFRERHWFEVEGTHVMIENRYVPGTGRIEADWTFVREGEAASTRHTSVRAYTVHELSELLRAAGFDSFELRDDALHPFELGADRLWLVATKGS